MNESSLSEESANFPKRQWIFPLTTAVFIVAIVTAWLLTEIPKGTLTATDELLTAERTREMIVTGKKSLVQFNFRPSFEKPPLQFWLTTLTLDRFENRSAAVRIWTLLYGVLTLIAVGWFATLVGPKQPWLAPLSVLVLASCPLFTAQATRGLLDIGLGFFTTMAIAFGELARKRPRWWLAVGAACCLGCLQKMPVPFLVWLLIVIVRACSPEQRPTLRTKWIPIALLAAIIASAGWPLLQILKYNMSLLGLLYDQVVVWTGPTRLGRRPYLEIPIQMLIKGGAAGFVLLVAPLIVLRKNSRFATAIREISLVSLIFIGLAILSNFRHIRYVMPIIPCLCVVAAFLGYRAFEERGSVRRFAIVALCVLLFVGFAETKIQINHLEGKQDADDKINALLPFLTVPKDVSDEKLIAEKLGELQQPGTETVLIESKQPGTDLLWDSFYLFHGNLLFPVKEYTLADLQTARPQPPLIGVCVRRDFPGIQQLYPTVQVRLSRSKFLCWQVAENSETQIPR